MALRRPSPPSVRRRTARSEPASYINATPPARAAELDAAAEQAADDATRADLEARAREAHEPYIARAHELQRTYTPPWWDPPRFGRMAESLGRARDMSSLLTRYERLDHEMEQLERATSAAASAWAAMCKQACQASREG